MIEKYIIFEHKHPGLNGRVYHSEVKYKIKKIADGMYYFGKDSIPIKYEGRMYKVGDIIKPN